MMQMPYLDCLSRGTLGLRVAVAYTIGCFQKSEMNECLGAKAKPRVFQSHRCGCVLESSGLVSGYGTDRDVVCCVYR